MDIKDFSHTDEYAEMVEKRLKEAKVSAVTSNDRVIKPCPFCGSDAKRNDDLQYWGDIFCTGCGCHMAEGNMDKAIEAWNKRAL